MMHGQMQIAFFCFATAGNVLFSRRMLADPRCHGFYRCFVFESIIILLGLNVPHWIQPRSVLDSLSTLVLTISLAYALSGFYLLCTAGRPRPDGRKGTDLPFENTTVLVKVGIYRFVRHPLCGSLFFLALGTYLKGITIMTTVLVVACFIFVLLTVRAEERENLKRFGAVYEQYRLATKRFIPFVW